MESSNDAIATEYDDAVDANAEAVDAGLKSASTLSGVDVEDSDDSEAAEAAKREASILDQIQILESLPEERLIPYLEAQLERFNFPKEYSFAVRNLTEENLKLFNKFLKVVGVKRLTKRVTEITYSVTESLFDGELFEEKFEAVNQELERVRSLLENRKQFNSLYPQVEEMSAVKNLAFSELEELNGYMDKLVSTTDKDTLDQLTRVVVEDKMKILQSHREELFGYVSDLINKELGMLRKMDELNSEMASSQELGAAFDQNDSWMDAEARESLESFMENMAADKKLDEDDEGDTDEDRRYDEMVKLIKGIAPFVNDKSFSGMLAAASGSKTERVGSKDFHQRIPSKEDVDEKGN